MPASQVTDMQDDCGEVTWKPRAGRRFPTISKRFMLISDKSQKIVSPDTVYSYWTTLEMSGTVETLIETPPPSGLILQLWPNDWPAGRVSIGGATGESKIHM